MLLKFKVDYVFLLQHAIRNDDSAKDKLTKINALTHQLNNSCKKFLKLAKERQEGPDIISLIEANRNIAARELY